MKFSIRRLQLAVAAVALALTAVPAFNRFAKWQKACTEAALAHNFIVNGHAGSLAMGCDAIRSHQQIMDGDINTFNGINPQLDPSRAAEKARLTRAIEGRRGIIERLREMQTQEEEDVAEHADMARRYERARWMPWTNPPL